MSVTTTSTITPPVTTTVRIRLDAPGLAGLSLLTGQWRFSPTRRLVATDHIVVPDAFPIVPSAAEVAQGWFLVPLPATDTGKYSGAWAWTVREPRPGGITRTVLIPTSSAVVEYASLASVDPDTLDPIAEPVAAWTAALDQTNAAVAALAASEVTAAQLKAVTDEVAQVYNVAQGNAAALAGKVDQTSYTAFYNVVVAALSAAQAVNDSQATQITALQAAQASLSARMTVLEGGNDGGGANAGMTPILDGGGAR